MNILILSLEGNSTSLGWRLNKEGHSVLMYIKDPVYKNVGDGFVKKVIDWEKVKDKADLIITDDSGYGEVSDKLKKEGRKVWGGSKWSDEIENDRGLGQKTLGEVGMKIIPSYDFKRTEEALQFVKTHPGKYCVKLSGKIQEEKALTYVGKEETGLDMISILENYRTKWAGKIEKLELQEVKKGIEVAIGGFFDGKDFVEPVLVSFEHKKLMPGDIGPNSGEMGTSAVWMNKNKIFRESIGRMKELLTKANYVGFFDINCIAEEKTLWPLEFTSRFGYPTLHLKVETIKSNMGEWMYKMSSHEGGNLSVYNPYSLCVVLGTPPFPFSSKELYKKYGEDQEIIFTSKDRKGIWPGEALKEGERWFVTGENGWTLIVSSGGKTIKQAIDFTYHRINNVIIPHMFYRNDIGSKTENNLKTLLQWGWFS